MLAGKVKTTLKLLTTEHDNGVHEVNNEIISELGQKHSKPVPNQENAFLYVSTGNLLSNIFR